LLLTVSCRVEFDLARSILQRSSWELFQEHVDAWRKTWDGGRFEVAKSISEQLLWTCRLANKYYTILVSLLMLLKIIIAVYKGV